MALPNFSRLANLGITTDYFDESSSSKRCPPILHGNRGRPRPSSALSSASSTSSGLPTLAQEAAHYRKVSMGNSPNPSPRPAIQPQTKATENFSGWSCPECSMINTSDDQSCNFCGQRSASALEAELESLRARAAVNNLRVSEVEADKQKNRRTVKKLQKEMEDMVANGRRKDRELIKAQRLIAEMKKREAAAKHEILVAKAQMSHLRAGVVVTHTNPHLPLYWDVGQNNNESSGATGTSSSSSSSSSSSPVDGSINISRLVKEEDLDRLKWIQTTLDETNHCGKTKWKLRGAERIENSVLYKSYSRRREEIAERHPANNSTIAPCEPPVPDCLACMGDIDVMDPSLNEVWLFHGTSKETAEIIARNGFDERVASLSGLYGGGIYMAEQICKSASYARGGTEKAVVICRATLGDAYFTDTQMNGTRRPPEKEGLVVGDKNEKVKGFLYDSIIANPGVGNGGAQVHREFVVFDRYQVYPQWIIYIGAP